MSGAFAAEPEASTAAARGLDATAADLDAAAEALRSALAALGDVCGGDEQGRAFAAAYQPRAEEGQAAVDALARAVRSLAPALDDDAAAFTAADEAGADALERR